MSLKKKILYAVFAIVVIIQFFRIDKSNPEINPQMNFVQLVDAPTDIKELLRTSCYDCHSHETVYPWYSNIAPVSWWLKDHINHGRGHLNFSIWGEYEDRRKDHKLEEIIEEVKEHEMPLKSYLIAHSDAKLDDAQIEQLTSWVQSLRNQSGKSKE